ncbi:MAG: glycosyltransferase family 39 protein [Candidatus Woesearchaeota archaeon]
MHKKLLSSSALLLYILILGLFLRLYRYTNESIWLDEAVSIYLALQPLSFILTYSDPTPPLFYILLHLWAYLGTSPAVLKLLTVIISTATIPAVYLVAQKIYNKKVALYAALFCAVSPLHVFYAQELRAYALLFLVSTFAIYYYLCFNESRNAKVLYVVFFIMTVYTHVYGIFVLLAIHLHSFHAKYYKNISSYLKSTWLKIHLALSITLIPFLYMVWVASQRDEVTWVTLPKLIDFQVFALQLIVGPTFFAVSGLLIFFAAMLIIKNIHEQYSSSQKSKHHLIYYLLAIPVVVPLILSYLYQPIFFPRHALLISIPLYIYLAWGMHKMPYRKIITAIYVAAAIFIVILQAHSTIKVPVPHTEVSPPVAFYPYAFSFAYIFETAPECFRLNPESVVYECAANQQIYGLYEQEYVLSHETAFIILTDFAHPHEIIERYTDFENYTQEIYYTNTDVGIFRNYARYPHAALVHLTE